MVTVATTTRLLIANRWKMFFEAFKQDRFLFNDVIAESETDQMATRILDKITNLTIKITPLLTPEQRKIAAKKLLAHVSSDLLAELRCSESTLVPL